MGWTSYHATHYKKGKVDRKAECDAYFMEGLNAGYYEVLKSAMVGSTYYAAVKPLKKYNKANEIVDIPKEEQYVFAAIFLTSTDSKDYFNFSVKEMDETVGPCERDCPKGILDLLTSTESEWANEWRKQCYENIAKKKNPNGFNKLPIGTVIKVVMPFDTTYFKAGQEVKLQKCTKWSSNRTEWLTNTPPRCRFPARMMKMLQDNYEIIKRGEM